MAPKVSKFLAKFRTVGVAYVLSGLALLLEGVSAALIILTATLYTALGPSRVALMELVVFVLLGTAFILTGIILFGLRQFVIYVMRLFLSWVLIFSTFGYMLWLAYRSQTSNLGSLALSSLILFIVITIIFYSGTLASRVYIRVSDEHKQNIDRIEDQINRIASKLSTSEVEQFSRLISSTRKSWAKLSRELFMRTADAPGAFYKALVLSLIFFGLAYGMINSGITLVQDNLYIWMLGGTALFTIIVIFIDIARLERIRKMLIGG